jgi:hypothetical protein
MRENCKCAGVSIFRKEKSIMNREKEAEWSRNIHLYAIDCLPLQIFYLFSYSKHSKRKNAYTDKQMT